MTELSTDLTHEALEGQITTLVVELAELDPDDVGPDVSFRALGIDSLLAMEIAVHVEERFGILFEEDDIKEIQTIRDIVEAVVARTGPGA